MYERSYMHRDVISHIVCTKFHPGQCEWIYNPGDAISTVVCSEKSTGKIHVYDGRGGNQPLHTFHTLHSSPLCQIRLNPRYRVVVSADRAGMLEYWTGLPTDFKFPRQVEWEYKTDTDLYEFAKCRTFPTGLAFSPDGKKMATIAADRKMFTELQQMRQQLPDMEFGRRMAVERELEKVDGIRLTNIIFDETGHFALYGTMLGIKQENIRVVQLSLFQGVAKSTKAAPTIELKASDNPALQSTDPDPTIFCTAFKKNRFYMFTKREPEDTKSADSDRDVFNEKPSKEEVMAATQAEGPKRVSDSAIIHTTMGDIHLKLYPVECPKTVENFCVHSRNGYYNGHIFHRVIKGFMIQTGDPTGTGMGGESIWGGEFEDEFHFSLRHDRPYTLSMANAGPGTNGSQFFLTVVPTPWLDNKHTVFGRTTKGMEVVQRISNVKINPKTDKPYEDISIISITIK
ncbi:Peptidylprolyl isomerase domain and WD repeat-containing protein 1 [Bagarius yarrelli]|uniref:peptidylprolyl isomerase n=1 Tax=Bagarius yarrelli TaxID=175774 RepID=A0A556VXE2_BAGYA|nr:Peptidylprolyl isomerase domain and WD repeat-containing protein 1 [Bagarius yarrelli]